MKLILSPGNQQPPSVLFTVRVNSSVGLRVWTLNVGTMAGKGKELVDLMQRTKVDMLCV